MVTSQDIYSKIAGRKQKRVKAQGKEEPANTPTRGSPKHAKNSSKLQAQLHKYVCIFYAQVVQLETHLMSSFHRNYR